MMEEKKYDRDFFVKKGKKGGRQTLKLHGKKHFKSMRSKQIQGVDKSVVDN